MRADRFAVQFSFSGWLRLVIVLPAVLGFVGAPPVKPQGMNTQDGLAQAAIMIRDRRLADAERELNRILRQSPNDAAALNLMGTIRAQEGRLSEAETLFTRAAKIDPSLVPAHMNLAFLYLIVNAPEKTIAELKEVVKLEPNHLEANYKLARLLLSRGRIDESISVVEKLQLAPPSSVAFLNLLGEAYLRKGNQDKAEENYRLALASDQNNVDAILGLAKVSRARGDEGTARGYLSQGRGLAGDSAELRYKTGVVALALGAFDDALADLEQALKLKPNEPAYLIALGAAWLKKPELFAAEQNFRKALTFQPDNAQAQMYLGYVLYKQKKFAEARTYLEKTIKTDGTVPESFYYLGLIVQEENEDERAIALLEKAIQISPGFANAHVALGASYLKLKDYPRAQQELELGAKLNPDDSKAHYQLAVLYARLKDPKRAQTEMAIVEKLKTVEQSQKREGDTFVITPAVPNDR